MTRAAWLNLARVLFLVGAVGFAAWGLRGQWPEIASAAGRVSPGQLVGASTLIWLGVLGTGWVWLLVMASYSCPLPPVRGGAIFFVGQLGKYIPGSVWSLGAQAQMARGFAIPARTTVAAGLVFLLYNCATALVVGCGVGLTQDAQLPGWVLAAGVIVGVLLLVPAVVRRIAALLAGTAAPAIGWRTTAAIVVLMAGVWLSYGLATAVLATGTAGVALTGLVPVAVAAFALAYLVGVVVVLAPSGLGARELVLGWLLAPVVGVPVAAAVTLLARVLHTVADFSIAGIAWLVARRVGQSEPQSASR